MKGRYELDKKFDSIEPDSLFISEITLAELKFGVANSQDVKRNTKTLDDFLTGVHILPIFDAIDIYALEKARLRKSGKPIDDFDLLIGATAITNDLILVTNNTKHFENLKNIKIENWIN